MDRPGDVPRTSCAHWERNQGPLTTFGLNNGAMGTVVAILYPENSKPPAQPDAVIVNFELIMVLY